MTRPGAASWPTSSTPTSSRPSSTPTGRCWSSPAPARARRGCSPTASPTSSTTQGVSPFEILAITFTNKAADEMKHRVGALVGPVAEKMWVSTFHSACVRILRRDASRLGYPSSFTIYDQADAAAPHRLRASATSASTPSGSRPRSVHATISAAKNDARRRRRVRRPGRGRSSSARSPTSTASTRRRLRKAGAMDFDDLLTVDRRAVPRRSPDVLAHYQQRFKHVLVDEYQDTNRGPERARPPARRASTATSASSATATSACRPARSCRRRRARADRARSRSATRCSAPRRLGRRGPATVTAREGGPLHAARSYEVDGRRRELRGHAAPHRPGSARAARPASWLVYLMHRADRGYRIGLTKSVRSNEPGEPRHRASRPHEPGARRRSCGSCGSATRRAEAAYWEAWFAAEYGLPTALLPRRRPRRWRWTRTGSQRLYDELDTETAAKALMDDLDLHPDFPHHRAAERRTAPDAEPHDVRRPPTAAVGYHRVQWSLEPRRRRRAARARPGCRVRPGKRRQLRFETVAARTTREAVDAGQCDRRRRRPRDPPAGDASTGTVYDFTPLCAPAPRHDGARRGATGGSSRRVVDDGRGRATTTGPVYDLEVDRTHTYVADGVLVHNSIYRFRGADIRNILEFEEAFPDATRDRARAELPVDPDDPRRRQRGHRQQPRPQAEGAVDRARAAASCIVRYHADDESDEAQWVGPRDRRPPRRRRPPVGRRAPSSTGPTPRAGSSRSACMRVGIPYKVVGGTRFYDRREIKDALAYLQGGRQPGRRVSREAGRSTCPSGASATPPSAGSTPGPPPTASPFIEALRAAPTRRA